MGAPDRTVRQLRLRATSEQAASRAVIRLEDALRCASLPDSGERLLLVRKLHLGCLPSDLSSQSLSLLIEQRVAEAGGSWVHGEQESADESDTVFFASRLQAAQAALRRRAEGRSLAAWHWRAALPGVQIEASEDRFLHSVIAALAQETTAPVSLPALVADIVTAGHAPWLIRHMPDETSWVLLAISGAQRHVATIEREWTNASARQFPENTPVLESSRQIAFLYRSREARGSAAVTGLRAPVWLHAVLRAAQWLPTSAVPADTAAQPEFSPSFVSTADHHKTYIRAEPDLASPLYQEDALPTPVSVSPGAAAENPPVALPRQSVENEPPKAQRIPDEGGSFAPLIQAPFDDRAPTQLGGLLFLINVLERIGFGEWQLRHPDMPLARLIFCRVLQRLRVPRDDPAWALVGSLPMTPSAQSACWAAPAMWHDERIAIAHDSGCEMQAGEMAERWRKACSRYLRRIARIGMASLCVRQARLYWSATHLDARFALASVDLRVRRAALDIDPGWLDWLQRVVSFEYTDESLS